MDARFAIAARHSRLVRILRVAVPAAVLLSMTAIVAISIFNPFRISGLKLPLEVGNLVVSGTKITMESPHLSGFSPDRRPYELWAKTATQDITDPDHVELAYLRAKMLMHKDIFLQSSTGYEARMTHALVDIANNTVTSDEPVDVKLLNGTLRSDRLRILDHGAVAYFEGNVVMNLIMDHPDPSTQPAADPAPPPDPPVPPTRARSTSGKRAASAK
jgi:lipopolysaccharide export system protein LptC